MLFFAIFLCPVHLKCYTWTRYIIHSSEHKSYNYSKVDSKDSRIKLIFSGLFLSKSIWSVTKIEFWTNAEEKERERETRLPKG